MMDQEISQYTLSELVQGLDVTVQGDPNHLIQGVATLQSAKAHQLAFLMNPLYKKYLATTQAGAVILLKDQAVDCPVPCIISRDPYYTYALIAARFERRPQPAVGVHPTVIQGDDCDIHPTASIGPYCVLGKSVKIGARAVIAERCSISDRSVIGEQSRLDANVTLYHEVQIGARVQIASGTVIGSDGFGIAKHAGTWHKVPQLGGVVIKDDVEIGSNCSIDRGAIEDTVIEVGAKLDNLIQIGHNVRIGKHTAIAGCVGVAGSAVIGDNCLLGGGSGIGGHITLTDEVMVTGFAAITKSIHTPGVYSSGVGGVVTNLEWRKNSARIHRLEQLSQRVKTLESVLKELIESKEP